MSASASRPLLALLACVSLGRAQAPLAEIKQSGEVRALAWSVDGKRLASGASDGQILISDFPSGKEIRKFDAGGIVTGLVFSPDGKKLGVKSGDRGGPLTVWDLDTGKQLRRVAFVNYACHHLAITADGQSLVASGPGEHMVLSLGKGGGYGSRSGQIPEGSSAAAAANGKMLAWTNPQGMTQLYDVEHRKRQQMRLGPTNALAFSPDAAFLAAASPDRSIRLWRTLGEEVRKFEGLREPADLLHFSGNGKVLAAVSDKDPVVRLWDVASGRLRRRLTTQPGQVRALALSPDGLSLALGSGGKVFVWNVAVRDLGDLGPAVALSKKDLIDCWEGLAAEDHARAEAAFRKLATARDHALDFLHDRIRTLAVPPLDWKRIDGYIQDLDDPDFTRRRTATRELEPLAEFLRVRLENYLESKPDLEGARRARKLLERAVEPELTPDRIRSLEAIEILEFLKTPRSRAILEDIARAALIHRIRQAARDALDRLARTADKAG